MGDVIRRYGPFTEQYAGLINDLERCGFSEAGADTDPLDGSMISFPYDWRRDNAESATNLVDLLDRIVGHRGQNVRIVLVAHSMGGLIARFALECGRFTERPGIAAVVGLITLGTPHRGAPEALLVALGQRRKLFLSQDQATLLARDPRFPSLYQLFPPRGEPFAWQRELQQRREALDVYDTSTARALNLVPENLAAAEQFHAGLDHTRRPSHVRYFCFVGTRQPTTTAVELRTQHTAMVATALEVADAGDGTVPSWSASLSGEQGLPVGGEHGTLYRDSRVREGLFSLFGRVGVSRASHTVNVQLALRDRVADPGTSVPLTLSFHGRGVRLITGTIEVHQLPEPDAAAESLQVVGGEPVSYQGAALESLSLRIRMPDLAGMYRLHFQSTGPEDVASIDDEFLVQSSN
ncbi:MAG: alpha/beta fold hydrolase [Gemmatimonadaceae bacterium]|nr:alpha/beta fold hydrolase [Gemmatimonadaceae bacterium]